MRLLRRLRLRTVALVVVAVVLIGLVYFGVVREHLFQVGAELPRTQFEVGEDIPVQPYLICRGVLPLRVYSGYTLFFVRVYDEKNREVLQWPEIFRMILVTHTIWPHTHYNELYSGRIFTLNSTLDQFAHPAILKMWK